MMKIILWVSLKSVFACSENSSNSNSPRLCLWTTSGSASFKSWSSFRLSILPLDILSVIGKWTPNIDSKKDGMEKGWCQKMEPCWTRGSSKKVTPPWNWASWSLDASVSRLQEWGTVFLFLCKGCVIHGWKRLHKMRILLMARVKKPKQAPRQLQYIAKISHRIKLSLKFWVNIFRQRIHTYFRQKCVSPHSFQIGVSIKDSHCPLAGPFSERLREGLKSTTVSPALLPHAEEDAARTLLLVPVSIATTFVSQ